MAVIFTFENRDLIKDLMVVVVVVVVVMMMMVMLLLLMMMLMTTTKYIFRTTFTLIKIKYLYKDILFPFCRW